MKTYKYVTIEIDYNRCIPKISIKERPDINIIECIENYDPLRHDKIPYIQYEELDACLNHKLNIATSLIVMIEKSLCKNELIYYLLILKYFIIERLWFKYYDIKFKRD